ncbi:PMEI [Musa troglodytarum]|uniref:PMEI n=1 Tax=Musa troglodytarum TaxID=320322 RepID=A0A9E7EWZ8_9LILI|nr:PMEI [Musa troglodytarum]
MKRQAPEAATRRSSYARCCAATLYPGLCYSSLAGYASVVQQNAIELAHVAAKITLARLRSLTSHDSAAGRGTTGLEHAALIDCSDLLDDAVGWARRAGAEMKRLGKVVGPEVAWRVSNALTWMSTALTDEVTCRDGFVRVAAGSVKTDVSYRIRKVKKYTSNTLALIHILGFN